MSSVALIDEVPRVDELRAAREGSRIEHIRRRDNVAIPVRVFGVDGTRTPVVMTHGLQSHSGWFVQSARYLAETGRPVYSFDRRGSGLSAAPRGDCEDYEDLVEEVACVVGFVSMRHGVEKVHVLGHCFGAVPAALYAARNSGAVLSLVLATPGIYTHPDLSFGQKLKVFWSRLIGNEVILPVPLELEDFSDLSRFQRYIDTDPLALREATGTLYYEIARARDAVNEERARLNMPIFLAMSRRDRICDNRANREYVESLPSSRRLVVEYEDSLHILEFSNERDAFLRDLAIWIEWIERGY